MLSCDRSLSMWRWLPKVLGRFTILGMATCGAMLASNSWAVAPAEPVTFFTSAPQGQLLSAADKAKVEQLSDDQFSSEQFVDGPKASLRPNLKGTGFANLPEDLYQNAITEKLEYDPSFNYLKRNRISGLNVFNARPVDGAVLVDKVVVYKSHYRMELLKDGKVVRKYWIALSDRPEGDKKYMGDRRTPEGTYTLDYINMRSSYYRSFHISYPNSQDIAEARSMGRSPGGMIMVHGQPSAVNEDTVQRSNWTNGCIAILNHEMDEFIELVHPGTPIEILP